MTPSIVVAVISGFVLVWCGFRAWRQGRVDADRQINDAAGRP